MRLPVQSRPVLRPLLGRMPEGLTIVAEAGRGTAGEGVVPSVNSFCYKYCMLVNKDDALCTKKCNF